MRTILVLTLAVLAFRAWAAPVDHVILVSVDGLRADLLSGLLANDQLGEYATFQRLVDEGAATFNARTDYTHTVTLPNHTCMVTGRPVLQPAGQPATVHHGYVSNVDPLPGDTLHNQGNPAVPYVASVFDVVHDHGLTTALYASKSKFVIFDQSYDAAHGAPDPVGPDDGPDKIDVYYQASAGTPANAAVMQAVFMADLAAGPADFSFVHYRDPDSAGHAFGWGSAAWNDAVKAVDGYLGELLDFVAAQPGLMGRTVVIVVADHGGVGTDHSVATDWRMYTIPCFVWGADVPAGADLYALNPGRRLDPGALRPDYNAAVPPIRNGDAGNLALELLGLPAIPGSTINAAQDLAVTTPVSAAAAASPVADLGAFPNPFNARTVVAYELERAGDVRLVLFDVAGRQVRVLDSGSKSPGRHEAVWDGRDDAGVGVASGVYVFRLETGGYEQTRKLVLVQ